jgi:thiol-disulfide isomerase/thioredoxin
MLKISNNMEEIIKEEYAIVYFTAPWCNPCKQLKPQFGKASVINKDIPYYMVDVDSIDSSYLSTYNIKSIPQIFEMNNGSVSRTINSRTAEEIVKEIGKNEAA